MSSDYIIDIKKARQAARLTQEQAAEAVGISVESWKAYEYSQRIPPRETMLRICEATGCDWLALEWMRCSCEGMNVLPDGITVQGIATAALQLTLACEQFYDKHCLRRLMEIASDGKIDSCEWPDFRDIVDAMDRINRCMLQVKFTEDAAKKETAPMVAHRSCFASGRQTENDHKFIIAQPAGNARSNFAGREVYSL